ncbi:MAG: hypothetical protein QW255_04570 [Candidatus Bilamarchaeaceae archaeon]
MASLDFGGNPLITPEFFASVMKIDVNTLTDEDAAEISFRVKSIQNIIRSYCGINFTQANYTEAYDSIGSNIIVTSEYPINSVTSLKFNGIQQDINNVIIHSSKRFLALKIRPPRGNAVIEITYNAGFTQIPEEIIMALIEFYRFKLQDFPLGIRSLSKMQESITYDDSVLEYGIPATIRSIFDKYKRLDAPQSIYFANVP